MLNVYWMNTWNSWNNEWINSVPASSLKIKLPPEEKVLKNHLWITLNKQWLIKSPLNYYWNLFFKMGFPDGSAVKNLPAKCRWCGLDPWVGTIPWRKKWQPTPVFLPGKSHGQWCLAGWSPWGHKRVTRLND